MHQGIELEPPSYWSIDTDRRDPDRSCADTETGYLGHCTQIIEDLLGAGLGRLENEWTSDTLTGLSLLVLPVPGGPECRELSPSESDLLTEFVLGGGGLLLLVDGARRGDCSASIALPGLPHVRLGDSFVTGPRTAGEPHLLSYDLTATVATDHPVTDGVASVWLHRARPIPEHADLIPLVDYNGQVVVAAAQRGHGKIAVVAGEMLTLPFLGRADNARLLVNLVGWLTTGVVPAAAGRVAERVVGAARYASRVFPAAEDLEQVAGSHVVDARPYRSLLERTASGGLPNPYRDSNTFLAEAELRHHELPRVIRQAVSRFRHEANEYGVLLFKGLPVDQQLPLTPADPRMVVDKNTWYSELWLAGFGAALGAPFAYRQERDGQLFQNIAPTRRNASKLSSESSEMFLDFHTEVAFHPHLPDYVMLYCLRPDHERVAKTIVASAVMALHKLSPRDRAVLYEPLFRTGVDYSFGSPHGATGNGPLLSVLYGDPYHPYLTFDLDLMTGVTPAAERALRALRTALNTVRRWVQLDSGDLMIIDNRRAVHGRARFAARYDGYDRWLQRLCVARDLAPSAADRRGSGRVIDTAFAL